MNSFKYCCALIWLFFCFSTIQAQEKRSIRVYASQYFHKEILDLYPNYIDSFYIAERLIQTNLEASFDTNWLTKQISIPVALTIFYVGEKPDLSLPTIQNQLEATSKHFNKLINSSQGPDSLAGSLHQAGTINLSFCLAKDPGSGEPVVEFKQLDQQYFTTSQLVQELKKDKLEKWNPKKCIRVWIAPLEQYIAGFAQRPGGPLATDVIVISPAFFGLKNRKSNPYGQGKTFTHLVGTYLGLKELWDEYQPCQDDYIEDTPIHNAANYGIPEERHFSMCGRGELEMTMNFMDGTDDRGIYLFTRGQVRRIAAVLNGSGPRSTLNNSTYCIEELTGITSNYDPLQNELQYQVFPNPARGKFTIRWNQPIRKMHLEFFAVDGKLVHSLDFNGIGEHGQQAVDVSFLPIGLFTLVIKTPQSIRITRLIIQN